MHFHINPNITQAHTLPGEFYRSESIFSKVVEKIFVHSWHYAADASDLRSNISIKPITLLPGVLDEPILFTRDKNGETHCMSNVCTHRGMILIEEDSKSKIISCKYHGRCFRLNGSFKSMPGFEQAEGFPCEDDNLPHIPFAEWAGMLFTSLRPTVSFEEIIQPIQERLSFLPLDTMVFDASRSKDYYVDANWALYCDNYLEGLHIPFVHPALNANLDFENYTYEIYPYCNLQLGIGNGQADKFEIPKGHQDHGKDVYAYYYFVFPNLMLNFYTWGLSINVVMPTSHKTTLVRFRTYLYPDATTRFEDSPIDQTEMEDEWVVERVQKGIQSRMYKKGRFSPSMEQGVHHFHQLISRFMEE